MILLLLKIAFEGIIRNGFQGDIAIDDVSIGTCSDTGTRRLHYRPPRLPTQVVSATLQGNRGKVYGSAPPSSFLSVFGLIHMLLSFNDKFGYN